MVLQVDASRRLEESPRVVWVKVGQQRPGHLDAYSFVEATCYHERRDCRVGRADIAMRIPTIREAAELVGLHGCPSCSAAAAPALIVRGGRA